MVVVVDKELQVLAGTWNKDKAASESMDAALDLLGIGGLLRKAMCLLKGCEIKFDDGEIKFAATSIVPGFKVTEKYPLDGQSRQYNRRDLKKGKHTGHVEQTASAISVVLEWPEPDAGHGSDRMSCSSPNELIILSTVTVGSRTASYKSIYRRA